ncbi:MAG: hypothetical protein DMG65_03285 [Candidatus Angelobacter sp. Gp1-AA117]|nr:MAG: hypothetical protein DMG65_03285 [Candidatus Angelobacter sp. Gp1-AA117]
MQVHLGTITSSSLMESETHGFSKIDMRLPVHLDRYPAKMVSKLADELVMRYASSGTSVLDPFCGSGAILLAAQKRGIPTTGIDINPVAHLLTRVKLKGFGTAWAHLLANKLVETAKMVRPMQISWPLKNYWFTPATLDKFERLRAAAVKLDLGSSREGEALLLSLALSVRLCSKADQRSPKPFISQHARNTRKGRHFDPYSVLSKILEELSEYYGDIKPLASSHIVMGNFSSEQFVYPIGQHSHIITSPPYINAQDYFRNFKLELYILQGILPFTVESIRDRFIGTERGDLLADISASKQADSLRVLPELKRLTQRAPRLGAIVHRYIVDMEYAFAKVTKYLYPNGIFVLVCGDNLIGGIRIRTWRLLKEMLEARGFHLFDWYSDRIENRMLAPKRCGHKGLIKEEVICAFTTH